MAAPPSPEAGPLTPDVDVPKVASPPTPDEAAEIVARLPELRVELGSDDAAVQLRAARDIRRVVSVGTCVRVGAGVRV